MINKCCIQHPNMGFPCDIHWAIYKYGIPNIMKSHIEDNLIQSLLVLEKRELKVSSNWSPTPTWIIETILDGEGVIFNQKVFSYFCSHSHTKVIDGRPDGVSMLHKVSEGNYAWFGPYFNISNHIIHWLVTLTISNGCGSRSGTIKVGLGMNLDPTDQTQSCV